MNVCCWRKCHTRPIPVAYEAVGRPARYTGILGRLRLSARRRPEDDSWDPMGCRLGTRSASSPGHRPCTVSKSSWVAAARMRREGYTHITAVSLYLRPEQIIARKFSMKMKTVLKQVILVILMMISECHVTKHSSCAYSHQNNLYCIMSSSYKPLK